MTNYREKQAKKQVRRLKLTEDDSHFVVRRPRENLGLILGFLAAVLFFFGANHLMLSPKPAANLQPWKDSTLLPNGHIVAVTNPVRPMRRTADVPYLAPPLFGFGTVFVGYLTAFAAARLFRVRIELDRQNNQVRVGSHILDSLSNVTHIGQARYKTISSRVTVTRYEVALFFRDTARKPLLICEFNSSAPDSIAQRLSAFLGVPIYAYQKSMC